MPINNMGWLLTALGGLGGYFSNLPQTGTSTGNSNGNTNSSGFTQGTTTSSGKTSNTNVTNPNINPDDLAFYNSIRDKYTGLLNTDPDLSGYKAGGISDINHATDLQRQSMMERNAASGISGPAAGANLNNLDANRFSQITKFNQGIPLLANQLKQTTLTNALNAFSAMPKGTTSTSNGTTDTTDVTNILNGSSSTTQGNSTTVQNTGSQKSAIGAGVSSAGTILALLTGLIHGGKSTPQTGDNGQQDAVNSWFNNLSPEQQQQINDLLNGQDLIVGNQPGQTISGIRPSI